jgi:uncharacterized protein YbcI
METSHQQSQLIPEDAEARPVGERGRMLADVSNAIVRIHKQFYGKGPTKARAHLLHDLLVVVLDGGYTRGEETLRAHGHDAEIVRTRLAMHASVKTEFRTAIEQIVLRPVRSVMSASDPANDLQAEIFVLAPLGAEELEAAPEQPEADLAERALRARQLNEEVLAEHRALRAEQHQARLATHTHRHSEAKE